jgi:hypothetical protein
MRKSILLIFIVLVHLMAKAQSFPSYAPLDGLVGWYPLDASSQARDISNQGNNGRLNGAEVKSIVHAEDRFGNPQGAMAVPEKDLFSIGSTPAYNLYPFFSFGGWCYSNSPEEGSQTVLSKNTADGRPIVSLIYDPDKLNCSFQLRADTIYEIKSFIDPMLRHGWHFVVGTFNGYIMTLYVDGLPVGNTSIYEGNVYLFRKYMTENKSPIIAGNTTAKGLRPLRGTLDDLFIYNRTLTAEEIQKLYESGSPATNRFRASGFTLARAIDNDYSSFFPSFQSAIKPRTANTINKVLQLAETHKISTAKNPYVITGYWWGDVTMPTNRLIIVSLKHTVFDDSRRDRPQLDYFTSYYFDSHSGDRIYFNDLFSQDGLRQITTIGNGALIDSRIQQDDTPDGDCKKLLAERWANEQIRFTVNPYSRAFRFETGDCDGKIFGEEFDKEYYAAVPWEKISPTLTPLGKFYFDNGPVVTNTNVSHIWTAIINEKIPLTLTLRMTEDGKVAGEEVYDNYGEKIFVQGNFSNGVLILNELDSNNKPVATIEATLMDRKLVGKWTKGDGTKTFSFTARIGGE